MQGKYKTFDPSLHNKTDKPGKDAALEFINRHLRSHNSNLRTIENPNRYGIDLLTLNEKDEVTICWEIEVRLAWKGDRSFYFDTVHCPERKDRLWKQGEEFTNSIPFPLSSNCKLFYVQLNDLCNRVLLVDSKNILRCKLKHSPNKEISEGEMFRNIPLKAVKELRI